MGGLCRTESSGQVQGYHFGDDLENILSVGTFYRKAFLRKTFHRKAFQKRHFIGRTFNRKAFERTTFHRKDIS